MVFVISALTARAILLVCGSDGDKISNTEIANSGVTTVGDKVYGLNQSYGPTL